MKVANRIAMALGFTLAATAASAQITVEDPWVRATVPGQQATGAFMILQSQTPARLVAAKSDIASNTEIHEMAMQDDVMKMREIDGLDLPADQKVALEPGGYHVMLLDLKRQAQVDGKVSLSLVFDVGGMRQVVQVEAPVRPLSHGASSSHSHSHSGHEHGKDARGHEKGAH